MFYHMRIAGLERDLPICPVNENLSIAGFVIFGDQELTVACARELLAKVPKYDYLITAEAKGQLFSSIQKVVTGQMTPAEAIETAMKLN